MLTEDTRLSLADLAAAGVRLKPADAVTIARELMLLVSQGAVPGVPSAHVIRLSRSGAITVEGPVAASGRAVSRGAQLLESLLPPRDAGPEYKVPGALRLCIVRALGTLDVPPYASLESFAEALQRFASPDAAATIRELVESWAGAAVAAAEARTPDGSPLESQAVEDNDPVGQSARQERDNPGGALVRIRPEALSISDIRRARRATGIPLADISARSRIPVSLLRQLEWGYLRHWPLGLYGRSQLVRYARAAGLDEQIVIATVWPMLDLVERGEEIVTRAPAEVTSVTPIDEPVIDFAEAPLLRPPVTTDAPSSSPAVRRLSGGRAAGLIGIAALLLLFVLPSARDSGETVPPSTVETPVASGQSVGTDTTDSGPAVPAETAQSVRSGGTPGGPLVEPAPSSDASKAVSVGTAIRSSPEPARGLTDSSSWSPTFASVGSAMFYHAPQEAGTSLMRADIDDDGTTLRITRVVDDKSQNYHARPSPDGTRIAFDSDRDGERGVYVAEADGTNVRRVSGDGFAAVPSWSPDGRTLAFVKAEPERPKVWNLWTLDLTSGDLRRVTSHRYGQPWGASWFPDARRIAYSHENRIVVLDLETGRERVYPGPRKRGWVRTPAVSPDGRRIVFQLHGDGAWLLDLEDASMRKVLADPTAEEYTWSPDGRRLAYHSRRSGEWGVWLMAPR